MNTLKWIALFLITTSAASAQDQWQDNLPKAKEARPVTTVNIDSYGIPAPVVQVQSQQSEPTGVIGIRCNEQGKIIQIYPYSRAGAFGMAVGMTVKKVDGKPFKFGKPFQDACKGEPGTYVFFECSGDWTFWVPRVDYRAFLGQDAYYSTLIGQPAERKQQYGPSVRLEENPRLRQSLLDAARREKNRTRHMDDALYNDGRNNR